MFQQTCLPTSMAMVCPMHIGDTQRLFVVWTTREMLIIPNGHTRIAGPGRIGTGPRVKPRVRLAGRVFRRDDILTVYSWRGSVNRFVPVDACRNVVVDDHARTEPLY